MRRASDNHEAQLNQYSLTLSATLLLAVAHGHETWDDALINEYYFLKQKVCQ